MSTEIDPVAGTRTAHAATQTFGLALLAATVAALILVSVVVFGGDDVAVFVLPGVLLGTAVWATARHDRQWARGLGIAATVVSLAGFFLAFGVFQLFSPIEFILGVTYTLGVLFSLVGGVRALRSARKGRTEPAGAHGRGQRLVLGVVGGLALISIVGFLATRQTVSEADAAGAAVIDMTDFEFDPRVVAVPDSGKLLVRNSDPFVHDFTLEELDIEITIGPGSEALVDLGELGPGVHDYFCSLHSDGTSGMAASLTVEG